MKWLEAKVEGLALDMTTNSPVVILAPIEINKVLPIWIGHAEAWGIAMELSGTKPKRPMTYDLLREVIETLKAKVDKVEITDLSEQTFFARIYLSAGDQQHFIDARPSDSIALALKMDCKIYINAELFKIEADEKDEPQKTIPTDPESLRERLRKINPEDFGSYSL